MEKSSKELNDWLSSVIVEWTDWKASRQAGRHTHTHARTHAHRDVICQSVSQLLDVSGILIARNVEYMVLLFS
jgi:hypothetical protein